MPFGGLGALVGGLLLGGSALTGALNGRGKSQSSTSTPTYSPEQGGIQNLLAAILGQRLGSPTDLDPMKTAAIGGLNRSYDSAGSRLESRYTQRGFGQSGKLLTDERGLEIARAGDLGSLESRFAGLQLDQQNRLLDLALKFGFANPGNKSTGQQSGNVAGGAVGGFFNTFAALMALNGGGGGGGGGGYSIGGGTQPGSYFGGF